MVLFLRKWSKNITVEIKPMLSMTQMVILHWDRCWCHLWWCSTVRLSDQNRNICCAVRSVQHYFEMVKWWMILTRSTARFYPLICFVLVPLCAPVQSLPGGCKCPTECEWSELTAGKWKFNFTRHLLLARM